MADVTGAWEASSSSNTTEYWFTWVYTAVGQPATSTLVKIPRTAAQDSSGYTSDFSLATGVTPNPGDTIGATLQVNDAVNNLQGPVQTPTPASITIPTVPTAPLPATGFTLTLS
jgi:hypothetical protein